MTYGTSQAVERQNGATIFFDSETEEYWVSEGMSVIADGLHTIEDARDEVDYFQEQRDRFNRGPYAY